MTNASDALFLDNTKVSSYKECPRKYYLRHILDWAPSGKSLALAFGGAWHGGMDGLWSAWATGERDHKALTHAAMQGFMEVWAGEYDLPRQPSIDWLNEAKPRTPFTAMEMYYSYAETREQFMRGSQLLMVEQPFAVPLYPDRADIFYVGKLDKVVKNDQHGICVLEHKTTTEYKKDGGFKNSFLDNFLMNSQIDGYLFGGKMYYENLRYVLVDAALVHDKERAFKFIPLNRAMSDLDDWLVETREWTDRMATAQRDLGDGAPLAQAFPRNTSECIGRYGNCPFLHICSSVKDPGVHDKEPPDGFVSEHWDPFEELDLKKIFTPTEGATL